MDPIIMYLIVAVLAMFPTVEALGAIAIGVLVFHLNPFAVFVLAFAANTAIYFPIFFGLDHLYKYIERFGLVRRFVKAAKQKGHKQIERYGYIGLAIYLAIPLPLSGTWTGTLIAWLLGLDKRKAFFAVLIGVFVACLTALILSLFAQEILFQLGAPRVSPI